MNKQQFQCELDYGVAMSITSRLLHCHLITQSEYCKIKTALAKKYNPVIGSLQRTASSKPPQDRRKEVNTL